MLLGENANITFSVPQDVAILNVCDRKEADVVAAAAGTLANTTNLKKKTVLQTPTVRSRT